MRTLPVLDINTLSDQQLEAANTLFKELEDKHLEGFGQLARDPVRRELDRRLLTRTYSATTSKRRSTS